MELWKSDGFEAGTVRVKDIRPGLLGSSPFNFVNVNGITVFRANDGVNGTELWRTDGTETGTQLIVDIRPAAQAPARSR